MPTLTTERIYQASDLRQNRAFIDEAKAHGAARLRDTDGASFLMVREADYGKLAGEHEHFTELLRVAQALLILDNTVYRNEDYTALLPGSPWPWLRVFDRDEVMDFVAEIAQETSLGIALGDPAGVRRELDAWRESAVALSDPRRRAALITPLEPDELVEITPE